MLVMVRIAPAGFVVNMNASGYEITRTRDAVSNFEHYLQQHPELPQKLIAMEPPLPTAWTDGAQVTSSLIRQIPLMRLRVKRCCQAISERTRR
ncbi:hypothetical protein ACNKHT_19570 [Shigella flexneri]